jgi:hypothetical protein
MKRVQSVTCRRQRKAARIALMRILPGIGAAGEWNGSVHNSQALAGQGRGDRWERIRDCRFGIKVPDLAPLRTPPDELRKTLHPGLVAVKKQFLHFNSRTLVGHGSSGRFWATIFLRAAARSTLASGRPSPTARTFHRGCRYSLMRLFLTLGASLIREQGWPSYRFQTRYVWPTWP